MRKKLKTIYGWGINDVEYNPHKYEVVNGKTKAVESLDYYKDWSNIIQRCFSSKLHEKRPTYKGCTIHEDWKYLSNFIKWVDSQPNKDWRNCALDKDLLLEGSKHYSPDTCVYVTIKLNSFMTDRSRGRGKLMIGVNYVDLVKGKNHYQSRCCNPFTGKRGYLGLFPTELEAHKAWQAKKHEHSCRLADLQDDPRVADALRQRYAPDKDWTNK